MEIEYKGIQDKKAYKYTLAERLTGQDFLTIRRSKGPDGRVDVMSYSHANLMARLKKWSRSEEITDESVLALPYDVYTVLYNTTMRLDSEEVAEANAFLARSLSPSLQQELASILEASSPDLPTSSEDSSPPEQPE